MKIYKERQFLVFDYENGKCVKYDFATKRTIGIGGGYVNDLKRQLKGVTINDVLDCCVDHNYALFLKFIKEKYEREISNIGTILSHVYEYRNIEQFFSAGITNIKMPFRYSIGDIPSGLIKLCKQYGNDGLYLSDFIVEIYKTNPDAFNTAFALNYQSLSISDIRDILTNYKNERINGKWTRVSYYCMLIHNYGYNAKSLMQYLDYLKTFEAIESIGYNMIELFDYARMMNEISRRFDRYPKHFLTTHRIATRNYNRLKADFDEKKFAECINKDMEYSYKSYSFIYPKCVEDIKNEAVQQNNCVASYIQSVIDRKCDILFLRRREAPEKSLVTIEVRGGKIVQAKQHYNYQCSAAQEEAIRAWNTWYQKKAEYAA